MGIRLTQVIWSAPTSACFRPQSQRRERGILALPAILSASDLAPPFGSALASHISIRLSRRVLPTESSKSKDPVSARTNLS